MRAPVSPRRGGGGGNNNSGGLSPRGRSKPSSLVAQEDLAVLCEYLGKLLRQDVSSADVEALSALSKDPRSPLGAVSPLVVDRLCFELEKRGLATEGVFRVPGAAFKTRALVVALSHLHQSGDEVIFKCEPNVHNVAGALTCYLSNTEPIIPYASYGAVLECARGPGDVADCARRLSAVLQALPARRVLQRVFKLCHEVHKQSEANQMTSKNLAIVFTPVVFHDDAEPLGQLAVAQGAKMAVVEALVVHYQLAFPLKLEPVYRPPLPGEVPLLTEREWALFTSKASVVRLAPGEVLLDKGQTVTHVYRVQSGVMVRESMSGRRRLIPGDCFGERALLGRPRCDARFVAEDEVVLWALSPNHLSAIWTTDARANTAFWGHVAVTHAAELRGQHVPDDGASAEAARRMSRMTAAGLRYSMVLREEDAAAGAAEPGVVAPVSVPVPAPAGGGGAPPSGDVVIVERQCGMGRRDGRVLVSALEVRFDGALTHALVAGKEKTVRIPYEAVERISTSVPDDVVRGKRRASKQFSKRPPFHTITMVVRKRKKRSVTHVERVLHFYCEDDAAEVFAVACHLFNTVSEDMLAARRKPLSSSVTQAFDEDGDGDAAAATRVVSKCVALFEFRDDATGFAFDVGDAVYLTTERRDLCVRGRVNDSLRFGLLPRDYVEAVVWVSSGAVKGIPTAADVGSIFSPGERVSLEADQVVVREGEELDALFLVERGVCRVGSGRTDLGKLTTGDIFGEVSFLVGGPASATVTTHTPVTLVKLPRDLLRACFAVRPDLAGKFYRLFAAVCLRRLERNMALPFRERQRKTALFATTKQDKDKDRRRSFLIDALV